MTREKGKNTAASIRARLLALAQNKGEDYQRVLGRYAIERFLYRLGRSPYRDKFAVKGATLFTLRTGHTHRPTKDLDLLGQGSSAIADVEKTIRGICEIQEEDGLVPPLADVHRRRPPAALKLWKPRTQLSRTTGLDFFFSTQAAVVLTLGSGECFRMQRQTWESAR